jgi:phage terminase large subunit
VSADLVALLANLHDDPEGFFRLILHVEPRAWQAKVLREIGDRLRRGEKHVRFVGRTCHGSGKTFLAAGLGLFWTSTRPGSRGLTLATSWAGVSDLLWIEVSKLYRGSLLAAAGVGRLLDTSLTFGDGWDLVGMSSNEAVNLEGRHGAAALRIIDEAKSARPDIIESTEGLLDAVETMDLWISVPSIPSGPFFSRDTNGGPDVIRAVVTIDDLIAEGLPGKAEWKAARALEWGVNSPEFESRCMARYVSDAEGALFPYAWVARAESAGFTVDGTPTAGLDVAGSVAGDASALAIVAGPDEQGRYEVVGVVSWHTRESVETQGRALHLAREAGCKVLAVDTVGMGYGVHGGMKAEKGIGIASFKASAASTEPDRFVNMKAQVGWQLRTLLEAGKVALPKDPALQREMLAERYQITPVGKIKIIDPSDSPDHLDAVLIALASASRVDGKVEVAWPGGIPRTMPHAYRGPRLF